MSRRHLAFPLLAWLLLALPGLLTLAPAGWPGVAWARGLLAADPLVDNNARAPAPVPWRWRAWLERDLQRAAVAHLHAHLVGRALIVRATNQVLYDLFRRSYAAEGAIVIGPERRTLHGDFYLNAWCAPAAAGRLAWAEQLAADLGTAAEALRARGGALVLLLSASKPSADGSDLPATLCRRDDSQEAVRRRLVEAANAAGVRVIDGIEAVRRFTAQDLLPAFPPGGVHWSRYSAMRLAQRLLTTLSAEAGQPLGRLRLGAPRWDQPATGIDVDYAMLLNLLWPPTDYPTATAPLRCERTPQGGARELIAVGTSFTGALLTYLADCETFGAINYFNAYDYSYRRYQGAAWRDAALAPVEGSPALWQPWLERRPLVVLELLELALPDGPTYTRRALDDLLRALGQ